MSYDYHHVGNDHPIVKAFLLCFFVFIVWGLVMWGYRFIMGFWDLEDSVWQMPYLIYTSIVSLITVGTTVTILIKAKRADDAAAAEAEAAEQTGE